VVQGSLNYTYLSNLPPLCSNTSPQVLYGSNTAYYASNALASVASSGNYAWASNALRSNVNDVSFSSNVVVGSGLTAYSLTTIDLYADNTISAQGAISSGGDIMSQFSGGRNIGTSGTPWGSVNTLTAELGDATTTTLSNSGVISLNSGDGDKIILTSVESSASKITHSGGWGVNYYAGYNTSTSGQHTFLTAYNGGFWHRMYINDNAVNITNKLAINQSTDSGVNRGIWWWNDTDNNWTSYFASSGSTRSSSGGSACASLDGRTAHHHRARAANSATQGFLWENASEQCLMSLTADSGNLHVRNLVQTSNITVGQTLTASNSIFGYDGYGQMRSWYSTTNNSMIHCYDGSTYYMLFFATSNGAWNSLRPLSIVASTGYVGINNASPSYNLDIGGTINATILKGSLDYNYLSNVPSLGTSAQSAFGSNTSVWSSNNLVKGSTLSNASYPIMITATTPRLGLLWNGGTSASLDFGFSTSAFQGILGASARIRADDNNYSASLSFQTRNSGSDNSNMNSRMVIQAAGNVGIGTTSPGCLLDVAGSARFVDTATTGLLTCSNGLAMKTNTWMTGTDNTNRMYFATSADTTLSAPNGQYNFQNNMGNTSVQITSNLGFNYPQSEPGFMISSSYGTKPSLDAYGYGQFLTGTVRAVISGSYSAASFRVCRPFNTSYTSWTDLLTVDSSGNTNHAGSVIGTNIQSNCLSVSTNQVKISVNAVVPPTTSTKLGGVVFQLSSAGWSALGAGATFTPVANSSIDNWSGKFQLFLKNVNTTVSSQVGYNDYVLNKTYGGNISITGGCNGWTS
jgi:hypothetical protein